MHTSGRFVHVEPTGGTCIVSESLKMTVKLSSEASGGEVTVLSALVAPGDGPPLHTHARENEGYYVLSGFFEFVCGENRAEGGPGTFVFAPRQVPHRYRNIGEGHGELLFFFTPGGIEGFFEESAPLRDREQKRAIAAKYGITML